MARLTKRVVDAAKPKGRDHFMWDDDLPGFGLRVFASGRKSYLIQYRASGRTRRYTIGLHGKFTPDEARKRAARLLAEVADGGDPSGERTEARKAMTVAEVADLYLSEGLAEKPNKKASSWKADASNIRRHILPLLGRRLAKSLTQADVARFQSEVAAGRTAADEKTGFRGRAIVKGGKGTAARSLAVLAAMLQFGVGRGLLPSNPGRGVKPYKGEKKERFLSEAEVSRLAETLATMEAEHALPAVAAAAIRLLLLTGCRKNEILSLRWEWIDFDRGGLCLPDSKAGARTIPLAAPALEILAGLPRSSEWVLPAAKGDGHYVGLGKAWERVRERAGLDGVRAHDLRHSFASFAVADGATLYLVGKVLGHRQARTTEVYAHLHDDPVRAVADRTAARIAAAMNVGNEKDAEVVKLDRKT